MAYTPTVWVSNPDHDDPVLTPTYLNKIETGIKDAHDLASGGGLTAGAGLAYSSPSVLAVEAGSNIVVNADDVALAASPSVTAITASQNNATAITLSGTGGGLTIGGDTNLYRDAADVLATDDELRLKRSAGNPALYVANGGTATALVPEASSPNAAAFRFGDGTGWKLGFAPASGTNGGKRVVQITDQGKVEFSDPATGAADTNLYRAAANQLQTDDSLIVAGTALYAKQLVSTESVATNTLLWSDVTGDTNPRLQADHNGKIVWGPGNATGDTNLYRDAADSLKTDDKLTAAQVVVGANPGMAFASGTLASRPTATTANAGLMYLATDTAVIYISSGAAWVRLSEPAGLQAAFAGATAPTGWVFATGASVLRTGIYADLFAQIGTTYGSADGSHFNLPDLRGRVPVGLDDMGDGAGDGGRLTGTAYDALGEAGGSQTVTLATAELPTHDHGDGTLAVASHSHGDGTLAVASHSHGDGTLAAASHTHSIGYNFYGVTSGGSTIAVPDGNNPYTYTSGGTGPDVTGSTGDASPDVTGSTGSASPDVTGSTGSAGSGNAHDNMPPFILQKWAIRL